MRSTKFFIFELRKRAKGGLPRTFIYPWLRGARLSLRSDANFVVGQKIGALLVRPFQGLDHRAPEERSPGLIFIMIRRGAPIAPRRGAVRKLSPAHRSRRGSKRIHEQDDSAMASRLGNSARARLPSIGPGPVWPATFRWRTGVIEFDSAIPGGASNPFKWVAKKGRTFRERAHDDGDGSSTVAQSLVVGVSRDAKRGQGHQVN